MSCPYFSRYSQRKIELDQSDSKNDPTAKVQESHSESVGVLDENRLTYSKILQLHKLLDAQKLQSSRDGTLTPVHDEHLFVITHQAFELWFKQILREIDSIREIFSDEYLEERNQLTIISRLNRVSEIMKLLCNQFPILETMTPLDFLEMRQFLETSSGFESLQFRMIEIKIGVKEELRIDYNRTNYSNVFHGEEREKLDKTKSEKSLFTLVNNWLERTPGLEEDGFNFFTKFKHSVEGMLNELKATAEECKDPMQQAIHRQDYERQSQLFTSLFDENIHNELVKSGNRRFSYKAIQGALMIFLYRDEPRCHLPFQLLHSLMDIDNNVTKFRYSHTCMVQRMIGGKIGTGGSSGYLYLRSTCSDRYKVFIDLMNLSSFLVTRDRIPPLTDNLKKSLSIHDWMHHVYERDLLKIKHGRDVEIDSGVVNTADNPVSVISSSSSNINNFSKLSLRDPQYSSSA